MSQLFDELVSNHTLFGGNGSPIKSIQRGTGTVGTDVTVSEVDMSKSELYFMGAANAYYYSSAIRHSYAWLANSTTISSNSVTTGYSFAWILVEYY